MSELDLKIAAVEFTLISFARADNEDARKSILRENFETIPYLEVYFEFTTTELKIFLQQLQQLKIDENAKQREQPTPQYESADSIAILRSALRISFKKSNKDQKTQTLIGNAVAISSTLALSALHGKADNGHEITLRTNSGFELHGKVILNVFEPDLVDIAVIELINNGVFPHFTPILGRRQVSLLESVYIIGYKIDSRDAAMEAMFDGKVNVIERHERSALFQSAYVSFDSLSGAGVVVKKERNEFRVIGVHVASHDSTVSSPPVKKVKHTEIADYESVSVSLSSLSSNIHGHAAYTVICEIARVPELIELLQQRVLIS